jgi:TrmH family RNA methyltransferase
MLSKNQVKYLHSLRLGKFRDLNRAFIAEGVKLVDEMLNSQFKVLSIFATGNWIESRKNILADKEIQLVEIIEEELKRISNLVTPNDVLAVVAYPEAASHPLDSFGKMILVLDRIQDPGNLGTIIRTADWFGIKNIVCSTDTADIYTPKVVQATMGSVCRVSVHYLSLVSLFQELGKSWHIYGTVPGGENIYTAELLFPAAVMIGNESKGISEEYFPFLTHRIGIPSFSAGVESLNASVAAGIVCSEFCRRIL